MNRLLLMAALAAAACFAWAPGAGTVPRHASAPASSSGPQDGADAILERAFADRISNLQVAGEGTVAKVLRDDRNGSRHQRFVVRLASGRTLLVAHNIDLAPRIDALRVGDTVAFYGEYEWNPKGGVIHWTHRDPQGRHPDGWIRHAGRLYQ